MMSRLHITAAQRRLLVAVLLALGLAFAFPAASEAHAILLRSDPAKDAVLPVAPSQVRMWFSEALNPAFSTAVVVNGANKRIDIGNALVSPSDPTEMDVTLKPNLPPAVYVVIYRTDSNVDGHILAGSFLFSVARPDGTVPTLSPGAHPGVNALGGGNLSGQYTGHLDGPTLFNLIMITLVELGAVFWVGAQLWLLFVLQPSSEDHEELNESNRQVQQRFEQRFALPTLLVLFLATVGVLLGQAINITGGNVVSAFAPTLLGGLVTSGQFGTFWLVRMIVIVVAIRLSLYRLQVYRLRPGTRPRLGNSFTLWANLVLGLALFIAIAISGHAAATSSNTRVYALVEDWLHLVAAALWVHLSSWEQLLTTAYGRALVVKVLLVGGLLLTSAIHVLLLRPRLKKEYQKYAYAVQRLQPVQAEKEANRTAVGVPPIASTATTRSHTGQAEEEPPRATRLIAGQVKLREGRLAKKTKRMMAILRWEPVVGVAVLVCVGLMNVFAGTLSPTATAQPQPTGTARAFHTTVKTADGKFTIALTVNPNTAGPNVFTVSVIENSTGKPTTNVGVSLYTTHLDMDMGTDTVNLQPDGKGHFSATGDLVMGGHWQLRIQIRTPDNTLHEATVKEPVPF